MQHYMIYLRNAHVRKPLFDHMKTSIRLHAAALMCAIALNTQAAPQSAFTIAPLGSVLKAGAMLRAPQETYTITNPTEADLSIETTVYRWEQNDVGESVLVENNDFVVFPHTLNIKKGETRSVRVIRRKEAPQPTGQMYYRVELREMSPKRDLLAAEGNQVFVTTRVLVPLVVQPPEFVPAPEFHFSKADNGLRVVNDSQSLVKISEVFCDKERVGGLTYVQPGRSVLLRDMTCAGNVTVLRENVEPTEYEVRSK